MVREILSILTDGKPFHDIKITEYKYTAQRMGMPSLTATLMYPTCLDGLWTHKEYVEFRGERYYIRQIPSSSKDNTDTRYKHEIQFVSERQQLTQIYFYDDVDKRLNTLTANKWCSNSSVFTFFGNIYEFVDRLNFALLKGQVGDSGIGLARKASDGSINVKGDGYYAVVEAVGDYDFEATKEVSFEDTYIFDAMTNAFDLYGIPFRFEGKRIVFGGGFKQIARTFKYGRENELLSIQKQNQNIRIVNRVTGLGGTINIPFYYPNDSEYDNIKLQAEDGNNVVTAGTLSIGNYSKLFAGASQDEKLTFTKTVTAVLDENYPYANIAYYNGYKYPHEDIQTTDWKSYSYGTWLWTRYQQFAHLGITSDSVTFRMRLKVVAAGAVKFDSCRVAEYIASTQTTIPATNFLGKGQAYAHHFYKVSDARKPLGISDDCEFNIIGGLIMTKSGSGVPAGEYYLEFEVFTANHKTSKLSLDSASVVADPIVDYFWQGTDHKFYDLKDIGIKCSAELTDDAIGDTIMWTRIGEMMPYQTNLVPPIFRDTLGKERFYNALNGVYYPPSAITDKYVDNKDPYCHAWDRSNKWAGWGNSEYALLTNKNGEVWRVGLVRQTNGTYRNDLSYTVRDDGRSLTISQKYQYIACKFTKPEGAVIMWDIVDKDGYTQRLNSYQQQEEQLPDGSTLIIAQIPYSWSPLQVFQIKVADIPAANVPAGHRYYDVYWIRAFESWADAKAFAEADAYHFNNEYLSGNPCEHIFKDEDIHPTIEGITNAAGRLFGEVADVAYDENDSDDYTTTDAEGDNATLKHSFFYIKLNIFNGQWGFDLFKSAIENGPMTIQMISGNCNGCKFKIQAAEVGEEGEQVFYNPVQVDENGDIVAGDAAAKVNTDIIIASQQNTETNSIWIAVQKDNTTFGVVHPNRTNNYLVKKGDKFNITDILLPKTYFLAAEQKLKDAAIKYMWQNNDEKFAFSFAFSRIFLANNPDVEAALNEDCCITLSYNGVNYLLFASSYDFDSKNSDALPEIKLNVSDVIASDKGYAEKITDSISVEIGKNLLSIGSSTSAFPLNELYALLDQRYLKQQQTDERYLSKLENDRSAGSIATDTHMEVGRFISGTQGGIFSVDPATGETYLEVDRITARIKAYFESVESAHVASIGGKFIITKGGNITITFVEENENSYRCYFRNKQEDEEITCRFMEGDFAYCQFFNLTQGATPQTNRNYWLPVIGVGEDYVDLAKGDGDAPMIGDVLVQLGSEIEDRQGAIILSTADAFSPDISVYDGIVDDSLVGRLKARFGNLAGIVDNGKQLSGFGIWCDSAYLHGEFSVKIDGNDTNIFNYMQTQFSVIRGQLNSTIQEVNDNAQRISTITQTVDQISLKVDETINESLLVGTNKGEYNWAYIADANPDWAELYEEANDAGSKIGKMIHLFNDMQNTAATSEQLQFYFDGSSLESGQPYTISFWAKGPNAPSFKVGVLNSLGLTTYIPLSETAIQPTDEWQKFVVTGVANAAPKSHAIILFAFASKIGTWENLYISDLKLERGTFATAWVEGTPDKLLATGIDIQTEKVTITANNFEVKNNLGKTTALLDKTGKLNVAVIDTTQLIADKVICRDSSGKYVSSINVNGDGAFILYGEDGKTPRVRFGFQDEGNGNASFIQYYDANGFQQWVLDINGTTTQKKTTEVKILQHWCTQTDQYNDTTVAVSRRLPDNSGIYLYREQEGISTLVQEYRNVAGRAASGVFYDCDFVDDGPYQGEMDDIHIFSRYKYTLTNGQLSKTAKVSWYDIVDTKSDAEPTALDEEGQ